MPEHDMSWVRTEMALAQAAPKSHVGPAAWARKNLFATPADSTMTIVAALLVAWALPHLLNWVFFNAVWTGPENLPSTAEIHDPDAWVRRVHG